MSGLNSIGDMAQHFFLQRQLYQLKSDMNTLAQELSSGRSSDISAKLGGDFSALSGIDHTLAQLGAFQRSNDEAALFTQSVQAALGAVQSLAGSTAPALLSAADTGFENHLGPAVHDARSKFDEAVAVLNREVAGRSLFAGAATDARPLVDASAMLADIQAAIALETTAAGVRSVVNTWFDDPGGGFETMAYLGATTNLAPFQTGREETAQLDVRADDDSVRTTLKGFALAALVAEGALAASSAERSQLVRQAGEVLFAGEGAILAQRAELGIIEERIERAAVANGIEITGLTLTRAEIVEADPFETATALEAAQTQLETLYTLTARLSRLNLTDFLR